MLLCNPNFQKLQVSKGMEVLKVYTQKRKKFKGVRNIKKKEPLGCSLIMQSDDADETVTVGPKVFATKPP